MRKALLFIGLITLGISNVGVANTFIINPKQILNVETGELIKSQVLIRDGKIIEISRSIKDSNNICLLYTSPSPRDRSVSRMPSSA